MEWDEGNYTHEQVYSSINSHMPVGEIVASLAKRGCVDLTNQLNLRAFSEHPVASGGFGDVYRGALYNGRRVAVKTLRLTSDTSRGSASNLEGIVRELGMWSRCQHPNVLKLLGVASFRNGVASVSPWMEYGNMHSLLKTNPEVDRLKLCAQIAEAIDYIHGVGIIHGDIKGANILFSDKLVPHLSDFGNSIMGQILTGFSRTRDLGRISIRWTAPELLEETGEPGRGADVYSLGMTMLEALTGQIPYNGLGDSTVAIRIMQGLYPARPEDQLPLRNVLADRLWSLLTTCWAHDPENRPNATKVCDKVNEIVSDRTREPDSRLGMGSEQLLAQPGSLAQISAPTPQTIATIEQSIDTIIEGVERQGCRNVTSLLDKSKFSGNPIRTGGSGDVYHGGFNDNTRVAVKCIKLRMNSLEAVKRQLRRVDRELFLWSQWNHPNILKLLGVAKHQNRIAAVSPWMEYGTVRNFLSLQLQPKVDRYNLCAQITEGVTYLHSVGIAHGDLKGDNILFSRDRIPQVADFGSATIITREPEGREAAGLSLNWAAPEVYSGESGPTSQADVYSLGMTLFEVATGHIPYSGMRETVIAKKILLHELPLRPEEYIPTNYRHTDFFWSILLSCWSFHPHGRPNSTDLLNKVKCTYSHAMICS